jgi:hypothetical protein
MVEQKRQAVDFGILLGVAYQGFVDLFTIETLARTEGLTKLIIEPDTGHVTLIHRASAPVVPTITAHRETVIRHIEHWEEHVA